MILNLPVLRCHGSNCVGKIQLIYLPVRTDPPSALATYWDSLEVILERALEGKQDSVTVVGDFNVNCLDTTASNYRRLFQLLARFGLKNHVDSPTRITSTSSTLIDLFLSNTVNETSCSVLMTDLSDHCSIIGQLKVSGLPVRAKSKQKSSRRLHAVDWTSFGRDLQQKLDQWQSTAETDIDTLTTTWCTAIRSVLDQHAQLVKVRKRPRLPSPWTTEELIGLVRKRNTLFRKLTRNRSDVNLQQEHRAACSAARRLDRRLKNTYFIECCNTKDQRKLWAVINTVTGRTGERKEPRVSTADLSDTFASIVHDSHRPEVLNIPSGPGTEQSFCAFTPVSEDHVTRLLSAIDSHKATGSDGIPGIVLKQCARTLAPTLTVIINTCMSSGVVPSGYKLAHITPIHKGGDQSVASNYRPVALLPISSRLLESVVKNQLTAFLDAHSLLPSTQFGYRKLHSTEDALVFAVNRWLKAKSDHKVTGVVAVDMSKAFDRVKHNVLISELFSLGLHSTVLKWFCSYLSGRCQIVRSQDDYSESRICSRGVPQGSVLGPLLFVLYTRHLHSILPSNVSHQEFADDVLLDFSHHDPTIVSATLSKAINCLAAWLDNIGLVLNAKKTQVMFVRPRGALPEPPQVSCQGQLLDTVHELKYLGAYVDDALSWRRQVEQVSARCARAIGRLWRHGDSLTLVARRSWYISMVQSTLSYASNAYFPVRLLAYWTR